MKKTFIYFVIIFTAVVLQTSVVPVIFDRIWLPDVVLSVVLAWSIVDGFEKFFYWSVFAGFLYDAMSFSPIGISVIIFATVTYSISFFSKRFSTDMKGIGFIFAIFFVFSATLGARMINSFAWIASEFSKGGFSRTYFMAGSLAGAFFWNMIFFIMFFYLINKIEDLFLLRTKTNIIVK